MPAKPRVLVTRSAHQSSALADRLRALGIEPVLIPAIEIVEPEDFGPLDRALGDLGSFDWVLFTSANGVEAFERRRQGLRLGGAPAELRVGSIGPATTKALEAIKVTPDLVARTAVAESLAEALVPYTKPGTRLLLVRAEAGRDVLPETLRAAGGDVVVVPAYRTVLPAGSVPAIRSLFADEESWPDAVTFTSSSTVDNLLALLEAAGATLPERVLRASIGPITSKILQERGYPAHLEASEATSKALAEVLAEVLCGRKAFNKSSK